MSLDKDKLGEGIFHRKQFIQTFYDGPIHEEPLLRAIPQDFSARQFLGEIETN